MFALAHDYIERVAAENPLGATMLGVPGHDAKMSDYSPDGAAAAAALSRETLAAARAVAVTNEPDRIARDNLVDILELDLERYDSGEQLRELSIIRSPLRGLRGVFDIMPRGTEEEWRNIAARLALVPEGIASFQRSLEAGMERGLLAARRQAIANAEQCEAWAGVAPGSQPFFPTLVAAYEATGTADPALRADMERAATAGGEAFAGFATFLRERYLPVATEVDGVGPDRYQLESRGYNGITLDLLDTYRWGWEELYRIEAAMQAICDRIKPGANIPETIAFLEADPARSIEGVEPFREWMQHLQDSTIAALDGTEFDIPGPMKKIEAMIAPPGGALAMYYTGPSEDFSRPGRTWYPTGGKTRFPLWGEVSIAYHEGVPGHHLERAHARYLGERISRVQRLLGFSGYVEGWGLYAERLMGELGYLDNPDYELGMLRAQALRSVRIIVDIGMHLGLAIPATERFHPGETWNAELGDAFCRERSCFPADFMASEVTRYLGTPGQAISYKVGERCWLEAREAAKQRAGASFDRRAFHREAFALGPVGLAQLQREMGISA
jgi:uncharacterized protein (DUF885 family)